jgi:hypothetical protein
MGNQCAGGDFNEEKTEKYEYTTEMNINRKKNLGAQNDHNENFNPHQQQSSVPERLSSKAGATTKPQPQGAASGIPIKTQAQPQSTVQQQYGEVSRQNLVQTAKGVPQQQQQPQHQPQQHQPQQYVAPQVQQAQPQAQQREHLRPGVTVLNTIQDYSNEFTREVLDRLGEFNYNEHEPEVQRKLQEFKGLPAYGPVEMENGALYIGQWKNGQRHGKGKQIWSDGSQYEGFWANDMANFRGRLIHSDGDVYEGLWLNDKVICLFNKINFIYE